MGDFELKIFLYVSLAMVATSLWRTIKDKRVKGSFSVAAGKGGGGGGGSPPPPPDPAAMARAQAAEERKSARANALYMNPSVSSPYGSVEYDTNSDTIDGETINRPRQTIRLSEAQQRQMDASNRITDYLQNAGEGLASRMPNRELNLEGLPERPMSMDFSNVDRISNLNDFQNERGRVEDAVFNRQMRLLQPQIEQQERALRERLVQTGNPMGSEAFSKEFNRFDTNRNQMFEDLADRAVLAGADEQNRLFNIGNQIRSQQIAESMRPYQINDQIRRDSIGESQMLRNQQINELAAMLQGREALSLPQQQQYSQAALRAPDIGGMMNSNYMANLNAYNDRQARADDRMSGLFSMGGTLAGAGLGAMFGGPSGAMFGGNMGGSVGRGLGGLFR